MQPERRYAELRADGRRLAGVAVRYGDTAALPWGEERIEPGAFGDVASADVVLNIQHDRGRPLARTGGAGLDLRDSPAALEVAAELPDTRDAADVLAMVRSGVLRGLSIEFVPRAERDDAGVRVIEAADLVGMAVVDKPAYPASALSARGAAFGTALLAPRRIWL